MYHRAGYGRSDPSNHSRTVTNIAKELNALLEKKGINEKFYLIGHSFGGLCVQQYAKMFPKNLKGVMLIDATSHNFQRMYDLDLPVMYSLISLEKMIDGNIQSSKKSKEELYDTHSNMFKEYKCKIPTNYIVSFEDFFTNQTLYKTVADEFNNWDENGRIINETEKFPNLPLIVLARDKEISTKPFIEYGIPEQESHLHEEVWRELQIELSELSNKGELIIAEGSDHEIHIDNPELLAQSIARLVSNEY